jgi:hypothetical protein
MLLLIMCMPVQTKPKIVSPDNESDKEAIHSIFTFLRDTEINNDGGLIDS